MSRGRVARFPGWMVAGTLLLALAACSSTPSTPTAPAVPSGGSVLPVPDASDEVNLEFGDGPFDLIDPTVGLADLTDYVALLAITFDGTRAGSPLSVSTSTTMSVSPEGRQLTIERGTDGPTTYRSEIAGISYFKDGDAACSTASFDETNSLAASYEPAAELSAISGADDAATDTVNGIASRHYTFDRQSVAMLNLATASGEVWVADEGGFVVRYELSYDAGSDYFGEGTTGTRTIHYELSVPDEPIATALPADCAPPVDAPLLTDAIDVVSRPGILSFTSMTSLEDATTFYTTELAGRGWEPLMPQDASESTRLLSFTKPASTISVVMHSRSEGITVTVVIARNAVDGVPATPPPPTTPPPTPAPGGHLEVQVGNAINDQVDGAALTCSLFDYGGGDTRWQLSYVAEAEDGLRVSLTVPSSGQPFLTVRKGDLSYAADGTGGSQLDATVDDRQSEVDFAADGQEFSGADLMLTARCANITRI